VRRTLLVVDDEALVRWSLRERFAQSGYTVLESETAAGAIAQFGVGGVDVVLLDCRLPDSDGIAVLRLMKALSPTSVVILMTAFPTTETAREAETYGACHYLTKPFDLDDVVAIVEQSRVGPDS
jgi:DNA-binding NtrC family response regulator